MAADAEALELVKGGHFIAPAPHSHPCTDAPKPTTQPHTTKITPRTTKEAPMHQKTNHTTTQYLDNTNHKVSTDAPKNNHTLLR